MEPLNTIPIQQYIQQVKSAESSRSREVRMDITTAKNLAYTLGIVMSRLHGDLETLVSEIDSGGDLSDLEIKVNGGNWS